MRHFILTSLGVLFFFGCAPQTATPPAAWEVYPMMEDLVFHEVADCPAGAFTAQLSLPPEFAATLPPPPTSRGQIAADIERVGIVYQPGPERFLVSLRDDQAHPIAVGWSRGVPGREGEPLPSAIWVSDVQRTFPRIPGSVIRIQLQ